MERKMITAQGRVSSDFISIFKKDIIFKQIKKYKDRIDQEWDKVIHDYLNVDNEAEDIIYAFVSFVEQEIEIGQEFNCYCYRHNPSVIKKIECRICSIINPLVYLPVAKIERGHKAICVLKFSSVTNEILQLPVIDGFHLNKDGNEINLFSE